MDESIKIKKKRINSLPTAVLEHQIRDERDYEKHVDYLHVNPVKHGLVKRVADSPHSIFHRYVAQGIDGLDWAGVINEQELSSFDE